jgi:hypothetical protein
MIYNIIGRREEGKTTLARYLASQIRRRIIFDPRGMVETGAERITNMQQLPGAVDELARGDVLELIVTPDDDLDAGFERFTTQLRRWVKTYRDIPLALSMSWAPLKNRRRNTNRSNGSSDVALEKPCISSLPRTGRWICTC